MSAGEKGFTLLEVLVAIAILGLGLTAILSSQVGLFSSASRVQHLTVATGLARCKMNEIEFELRKDGFSLFDVSDEGNCCGDDPMEGYSCSWKVELVELPEEGAALADAGVETEEGDLGPLSILTELQEARSDPAAQGPDALANIAQKLGSGAMGAGMGPMVMGMVYPQLKPMLEASIRKITVSVNWREGTRERDLSVTQFFTDPQQGNLDEAGLGDGGLPTAPPLLPIQPGGGVTTPGLPGLPGLPGAPGSGT